MPTLEEKLKNYIKEDVGLNPNRYKGAKRKYEELREGLLNSGFNKIELQGSFALKTAIKPVNDTDEYDVDILIQIDKTFDLKDTMSINNAKTQLIDTIDEIAKAKMWGDYEIRTIKKGFEIAFSNDFHIDVIPVFNLKDENGGVNTYLFDFTLMTPERNETFKLTESLLEQIDDNKRILLMLIKKIVQQNTLVNLNILPSVGSALMHIDEITKTEGLNIKTMLDNMSFVIQTKCEPLVNPFLISEEFFEKTQNKGREEDYLVAIDSLRLTLEQAYKENNLSILTNAISGKAEFIPSNGIKDKGGSGGHA